MAIDYVDLDRSIEQLENAIDMTQGNTGTDSASLGGTADGNYSVAVGKGADADGVASIAIGDSGTKAKENGDIAIGSVAKTDGGGVGVGAGFATAVGAASKASAGQATAIGALAKATGYKAIQIGEGTNAVQGTCKVYNTTLIDATGKIPFSALQGGEVVGLSVNSSNHLIVTYANGTTADLGTIGGGGGTSDYTQLTNKPQVNGETLTGNKTSAQLGLQSELVSSTNIKTVNGSSLLGSGNLNAQEAYDVELTTDGSDYYISEEAVAYLYANKPPIVHIIAQDQNEGIEVSHIATIIGENYIDDGEGHIFDGKLNYIFYYDIDGADENIFVLAKIPKQAADAVELVDINIQEKLSFDDTPTYHSTNPITSGGVYNAIGDINTALANLISGGGVQ